MKGITVVICCYNSASRLHETLKHLYLQKKDNSLRLEIIIVDNASTDDTVFVASEIWKQFKNDDIIFKVIEEKQPGLSFARQCGVSEAKYEYIIFCDDDNWLHEDYVQTAYRLISADKTIGVIGGISTAIGDAAMPAWFAKYEEIYSVGKHAPASGIINNKGYVCGAGMVTRKTVFENAVNNKFPFALSDRKGNALSGGGDVEYCLRLILQGYNIFYSEDLVFKHYIPAYRLTEQYRDDLLKGAQNAQWILKEYFEAVHIKNSSTYIKFMMCNKVVKDGIKSLLRNRDLHPSSRKLLYYLFNIGFKNNAELAVIKHFYNYRHISEKLS